MERWKRQFIKKLFHYDAGRMNIEAAFMVKHPHIPQSLYKYRSFLDTHKEAFLKDELWTASADKLNDPNECGAFFRLDAMIVDDLSLEEFESRIADLKEDNSRVAEHHNEEIKRPTTFGKFIDDVFEAQPHEHETEIRQALKDAAKCVNQKLVNDMSTSMRSQVGVLSLSATYQSTLMWAHYSDSHRGFVVEYDFGSLDYQDLRRRVCFPVFYSKKQRDITNYIFKKPGSRSFNNLFGQYIALIKEAEWAYEMEWRIVTMIGSSMATQPLPMPKPKSVILGKNCSEENTNWIVSTCSNRNIPVFKMTSSDRYGNSTLESVCQAP